MAFFVVALGSGLSNYAIRRKHTNMKSRISIEVDFDNGNVPFIQILEYPLSTDVRDKLITSFRQSLGFESNWLRIEFPPHKNTNDGELIGMNIYPVRSENLLAESELMKQRATKA